MGSGRAAAAELFHLLLDHPPANALAAGSARADRCGCARDIARTARGRNSRDDDTSNAPSGCASNRRGRPRGAETAGRVAAATGDRTRRRRCANRQRPGNSRTHLDRPRRSGSTRARTSSTARRKCGPVRRGRRDRTARRRARGRRFSGRHGRLPPDRRAARRMAKWLDGIPVGGKILSKRSSTTVEAIRDPSARPVPSFQYIECPREN